MNDYGSLYELRREDLAEVSDSAAGTSWGRWAAGLGRRRGRRGSGLRFVLGLSCYVLSVPVAMARPVTGSGWFAPSRDAVADMVSAVFDGAISVLVRQLRAHPGVQALAETLANRLLQRLVESEQLAESVAAQADRYLDTLADRPDVLDRLVPVVVRRSLMAMWRDLTPVNHLVETVLDEYLRVLSAAPTKVRPLVQTSAGEAIEYLYTNPEVMDAVVQ